MAGLQSMELKITAEHGTYVYMDPSKSAGQVDGGRYTKAVPDVICGKKRNEFTRFNTQVNRVHRLPFFFFPD